MDIGPGGVLSCRRTGGIKLALLHQQHIGRLVDLTLPNRPAATRAPRPFLTIGERLVRMQRPFWQRATMLYAQKSAVLTGIVPASALQTGAKTEAPPGSGASASVSSPEAWLYLGGCIAAADSKLSSRFTTTDELNETNPASSYQ